MPLKLEVTKQPETPGGARLDRHEAEARQDRWMMEVERALLASGSQRQAAAPAAARSERPAARAPGGAEAALTAAGAGQQAAPAPHAALRDAGAPAAMAAGQHAESVAQAGGDDAAAGAKARDGRPAGLDRGNAASDGTGAQETVDGQAAAQAAPIQLNPLVAGGFVAVGTGAGAAAAPAAASLSGVAGAARQWGGPVPAPEGQAAAPGLLAEPEPDAAPEAHHAAGLQGRAEAEAFAKRLMHVYLGDDGMHAWIRDAALGPNQVRAVVQAMAGEFAAGGVRLAALSINGKAVAGDRAGAGSRDDDDPIHEQPRAAAVANTPVPAANRQGDA